MGDEGATTPRSSSNASSREFDATSPALLVFPLTIRNLLQANGEALGEIVASCERDLEMPVLKRLLATKLDSASQLLNVARTEVLDAYNRGSEDELPEDEVLDPHCDCYYVFDRKSAPLGKNGWAARLSDRAFGFGTRYMSRFGLPVPLAGAAAGAPPHSCKYLGAARDVGEIASTCTRTVPGEVDLARQDQTDACRVLAREFAMQLTAETSPCGDLFLHYLIALYLSLWHISLPRREECLTQLFGGDRLPDGVVGDDTWHRLLYEVICFVKDTRLLTYSTSYESTDGNIISHNLISDLIAYGDGADDNVDGMITLPGDLIAYGENGAADLIAFGVRKRVSDFRSGYEVEAYFEALFFRRKDVAAQLINFQVDSCWAPTALIWDALNERDVQSWMFSDPELVAAIAPEVLNDRDRRGGHSLLSELFVCLEIEVYAVYSKTHFAATSLLDAAGRVHLHPLRTVLSTPGISLSTLTSPLPLGERWSGYMQTRQRGDLQITPLAWVDTLIAGWLPGVPRIREPLCPEVLTELQEIRQALVGAIAARGGVVE